MAAIDRGDLGAQVVPARDTSRLMTACYSPVILITIIGIISITELALTCLLQSGDEIQLQELPGDPSWGEPDSQGPSSPGGDGSEPRGSQSFTPPTPPGLLPSVPAGTGGSRQLM